MKKKYVFKRVRAIKMSTLKPMPNKISIYYSKSMIYRVLNLLDVHGTVRYTVQYITLSTP